MRPALILLLAGCGRFGFGSPPAGDGAAGDAMYDAAGDASDATDAPAGCAFDICEDFEGATIDTARWETRGSVDLATTVAHTGAQSLHVRIGPLAANVEGLSILAERTAVAPGTPFWVRIWVKLGALPELGNGLELVVAEQEFGPNGDYLFVLDDDVQVYSQFSELSASAGTQPVADTWTCLVWSVVPRTTMTGSISVAGDAMATLPNVQTTDAANPLDILFFGAHFSSTNVPVAQPALDLWYDDVIIGHAPITCAD